MRQKRTTKELHFSRLVSHDYFLQIHPMNSLRLRAVLYREDGLWVAHALEMDLIGTGATESAALRELRGNVEAQLSFATQEGVNPFRPAPQEFQSVGSIPDPDEQPQGISRFKSKPLRILSFSLPSLASLVTPSCLSANALVPWSNG